MPLAGEDYSFPGMSDSLDARTQELGREIFERSSQTGMNLFDKGYWSGKMMEWSMNIPAFKVEMFRFVDVLPSLHSADQISEHIRQYFLRDDLDFPGYIRAGLGVATANWLTAKVAASAIRKNVASMAETFITGADAAEAKKALEKLWNNGFCFTVDILGEAAVSESESGDYQRRYLDLVRDLALETARWKAQAQLEEGAEGLAKVPRANVSVKCSSLYSQIDPMAFDVTVRAIKERLRPILRAAVEHGVFVNLDMEQHDYRELLLTVAEEIFSEPEFREYPHFGIVIQAYLKCAIDDLKRVRDWNGRRSAPLTVRLVKGAYWDYEVVQCQQKDWPVPVFTKKAESDANYERCAEFLLDSYPTLLAAFGSHNVRSLAFAMAYAEKKGLPKNAFEVQMLFGMAEPFKKAVTGMGYRVREYAPVGEMLPGMAYLVRRLLENTSNEGFLRAKFVSHADASALLEDPRAKVARLNAAAATAALTPAATPEVTPMSTSTTFANEPLRDFSRAENRAWIAPSLQALRARFPLKVHAVVNGEAVTALAQLESRNPSDKSEIVALYSRSGAPEAEAALAACEKAMKTWGTRPAHERANVIRRAGEILRARKNELVALMTLETGKNFREADADVAEAVDFCFYYAQEMERLGVPRSMGSLPGEQNQYVYGPRGPAVAIAPWNFPLAILCGMAVGPLVCGNPVVLKPAEQSPGIAGLFYEILREAGVPAEAVHLLPGLGEEVGAYLVAHSKVHIINFTGSREVGLRILEEGAKLRPGQRHLKKVVCELGGKNAILVDDDADLDEAVAGALTSAFGFQGQKCSALSRLIVHESCYDRFRARLLDAMKSLKVGPAEDPSAKVGPVIDGEAHSRLLATLEKHRARVLASLEVPAELRDKGYFVPPTVFEESDSQGELMQREFFGPFVTLYKAKSFDEMIEVANGVDYALTGGIYSRSPKNISEARERLEVGNLYINRGITGALVFRQPFGGFKLSGVGAKAGGPDYLLNFLEPRTITENTMRRGFAPEV